MTVSGKEVLLVDQNWHNAPALSERLHRWGFRCHVVSNMRAAFDLLSSHPVDLVLSSTNLSDGNSFDWSSGYRVPPFAGRC